jgi:phosphatidylglycerophosphate synthase
MSQPRELLKHSRPAASDLDRSLLGLTVVGALALAAVVATDPSLPAGAWLAAPAGWFGYALTVRRTATRAGLARFGGANRVTALRGLLVSLIIPFLFPSTIIWLPVALGAAALALDGLDGAFARRSGTAGPFGARFDMETDALTVLMLSALVATEGRVGAWVLLSGAARYLYVAAGRVWPSLRRPPPPSFARKLVCVLQIAGLLLALCPALPPPWPTVVAAVSLLLLAWSFGRDIWWLLRDGGMAESSAAPYLNDLGGV